MRLRTSSPTDRASTLLQERRPGGYGRGRAEAREPGLQPLGWLSTWRRHTCGRSRQPASCGACSLAAAGAAATLAGAAATHAAARVFAPGAPLPTSPQLVSYDVVPVALALLRVAVVAVFRAPLPPSAASCGGSGCCCCCHRLPCVVPLNAGTAAWRACSWCCARWACGSTTWPRCSGWAGAGRSGGWGRGQRGCSLAAFKGRGGWVAVGALV